MMNKTMKKLAIALATATMTLTAASAVTFANDGLGIDTMSVTVQAADQYMYVIAKSGANVRTAPSTSGQIITALTNGTKVHVTGNTSNGWCQVIVTNPTYGGESAGYIAGNLLSANKDAAIVILPSTTTTTTTTTTSTGTTKTNPKYPWIIETNSSHTTQLKKERGEMSHDNDTFTVSVIDGYLALRSSAVTDPDNEIGQLKDGQYVRVQTYGTQFDYVYAPSLDKYGYVNNDYLK